MRLRVWLAAAALLLACSAGPAAAAGLATCTLTATPLAFGRIDPQGPSPGDSTATLEVTCTATGRQPAEVNLGVTPLGGTVGVGTRHMQPGAGPRYQIFVDAARSVPWGDGQGGSMPLTARGMVMPGTPFRVRFTLYGRVPGRQHGVAAGTFMDGLVAVLTY